jgi:hypothetical protein
MSTFPGDRSVDIINRLTCLNYNGHDVGTAICLEQIETQPNSKLFRFPYYNKYQCLWDKYVSLSAEPQKCLLMDAPPHKKDLCLRRIDEASVSKFYNPGEYGLVGPRPVPVVRKRPFEYPSKASMK